MTTTTQQVKCARCNVPLEGSVADPQPDDHVSCPSCGEGDTLENVTREVGEYVTQKMAESLDNSFKGIERQSGGFLKVTVDHGPHRNYRFVIDIEL